MNAPLDQSQGLSMGKAAVLVIDEREKKPYEFADSQTKRLTTGDYTLLGLEDEVAIERKSLADVLKSIGQERDRFRREVGRLGRMRYAAIVIEGNLSDLLRPPTYGRMNPRCVVQTLLSWSVRFGVHVFFAGDREHARALTRYLLERFWHYRSQVERDGERDQQD